MKKLHWPALQPRKRTARLKCCFMSTETVGLSGTGAWDGHRNFHTAPELCGATAAVVLLNVRSDIG